jgi:hypothetical protein
MEEPRKHLSAMLLQEKLELHSLDSVLYGSKHDFTPFIMSSLSFSKPDAAYPVMNVSPRFSRCTPGPRCLRR